LRIAVTAGVWLAARGRATRSRSSPTIALDAVGDVASTLGVSFRRLSYSRALRWTRRPDAG